MADWDHKYRTGCSGWSYKAWVGPFYPKGTAPKDYLSLYSKVFNVVEIDSTFYSIPGIETVKRWYDATPEDFEFTAKLPRTITHDRKLSNSEMQLKIFLDSIGKLGEKLRIILIQLPHSFNFENGNERFEKFTKSLPKDIKFAVEFRDSSWYSDEVRNLLSDLGVGLAWSDIPYTDPPEWITSQSLYLRLVGDRAISEGEFGKIQRSMDNRIKIWGERLSAHISDLEEVFIFSNNHYQGFGPGSVNLMRKELGLESLNWEFSFKAPEDKSQSSIFDWQ